MSALKGKTIPVSSLADAEQPDFKEFSVDVASMLQSLKNWTDGLVAAIVKEDDLLKLYTPGYKEKKARCALLMFVLEFSRHKTADTFFQQPGL